MELKDFTYQLHQKGSEVAGYRPNDRDEPASGPRYYGFTTDTGTRYVIIREVITNDETATRYAYWTSGYTTAWAGRADLDYYYYYQIKEQL